MRVLGAALGLVCAAPFLPSAAALGRRLQQAETEYLTVAVFPEFAALPSTLPAEEEDEANPELVHPTELGTICYLRSDESTFKLCSRAEQEVLESSRVRAHLALPWIQRAITPPCRNSSTLSAFLALPGGRSNCACRHPSTEMVTSTAIGLCCTSQLRLFGSSTPESASSAQRSNSQLADRHADCSKSGCHESLTALCVDVCPSRARALKR
jgi:hypothetical protein